MKYISRRYILLVSLLLLLNNLNAGYLERFNHPELEWNYIYTGDFNIYYSGDDTAEAIKVARILEGFKDSVNFVLGTKIKPTNVILNNYDMVANGFAMPLGDIIFIYTKPDYLNTTGNIDWLRRVARHEYSHIVTFRALTPFGWGTFRILTMSSIPTWFYEGIAQYCAESWDENREMFLKAGFIDNTILNYNFLDQTAINDIIDGRYFYEEGHSIVRAKMKENKNYIKDILNTQSFLGLLFPFQFNYLLSTGHLFYTDFEKWKSEKIEMYKIDKYKDNAVISPVKYVKGYLNNDSIDIYCGFNDLDRFSNELFYMKGNKKYNVDKNAGAYFDISSDGTFLIYSKKTHSRSGTLCEDIILYDIEKGKRKNLTKYAKVTNPTFFNCSTVVYTELSGSKGILRSMNINSRHSKDILEPNDFEYLVTPSCYNGMIAYEHVGKTRYIKIINIDGYFIDSIYSPQGEARQPYFYNDSLLYFVGYFDGKPDIYKYNINAHIYNKVIESVAGVFQPFVNKDSIYYIDYRGKSGFLLCSEEKKQKINKTDYKNNFTNVSLPDYYPVDIVRKGKYNAISSVRVKEILPLIIPDYYIQDNSAIYFNPRLGISALLFDPLMKNVILGFVCTNIRNPIPTIMFNYINSMYYPTITLYYMRFPFIKNYYPDSGKFEYDITEEGVLLVDVPYNLSSDARSYSGFNIGIYHTRWGDVTTRFADLSFYYGIGVGTYNGDVLPKDNFSIVINEKFASSKILCYQDYNLFNIHHSLYKTYKGRFIYHYNYDYYFITGDLDKTSVFTNKGRYDDIPNYKMPQSFEIGGDFIIARNVGTNIGPFTLPYLQQFSMGLFNDFYFLYDTNSQSLSYRNYIGIRGIFKISYYYITLPIEVGYYYDIKRQYIDYYIHISYGVKI